MTVQELLGQLVRLDIRLWMDGERLHYSAPQGVMTSELLTELAKHKARSLLICKVSLTGIVTS